MAYLTIDGVRYDENDPLPDLPSAVHVYAIGCTGLTSLPDLPSAVHVYAIGCTGLTSLPDLPSAVHVYAIGCTGLTSLPDLPSAVHVYAIGCTGLTSLPDLPSAKTVNASGCTGLTSLCGHALPDGATAATRLRAVATAALATDGSLNMESWHHCETTHCIAGWAIAQAGETGAALEKRWGSHIAGAILLGVDAVDKFYIGTSEAREWLRGILADGAEA